MYSVGFLAIDAHEKARKCLAIYSEPGSSELGAQFVVKIWLGVVFERQDSES